MPFKPEERQYRNFAASNFQPVTREDDADEKPSYVVRGYFTTFNEPYLLDRDFYETISPRAFDDCEMDDVILQMNHDGFVYARTRNGSLKLGFDEHGGYCEADLSGTKQGREDLYEAITNGLIDRMSFGFIIADDGFEFDEDDDGTIRSTVTRISKLFDVSAIAGFPANPGTEIHARSYLDGAIEAKHQKQQELLRRAEQRKRTAAALELIELI